MQNSVSAVLLDTMSIQRYIFSSNNLIENIGASQIVEDIYDTHLEKVIEKVIGEIKNTSYTPNIYDAWKENPEKKAIIEDQIPFEVGYIGGGNALLFFKDENKAKEFIKEWSMELLICCPGLIPACSIGSINFDNFSNDLGDLFKQLSENKSSFVPETIIKRHGITAQCAKTGYSAEVWLEGNYISYLSYAKINAAKNAKEELENFLKESNLIDKYTFTSKLDELGQEKGEENYIAIVHIDGNDVGSRIRSLKEIKDLREFSKKLKEATENAFKTMLLRFHDNINTIDLHLKKEKQNGKTILPLRPIIIGGDDITFVSNGKLGIWLAKNFIEAFEEETKSLGHLTACAGIAITKTKYPFYRGYRLSEELTRSAKDKRKELKDSGSWIDFHITSGGFSGELTDIRDKHYKSPSGYSLTLRPYKIEDFEEMVKSCASFNNSKTFPHSKIMELREILYSGKQAEQAFVEKIKARGLELPVYKEFNGKEISKNNQTPYFDMIEIMDFYPDCFIRGNNENLHS